MKQTKNQKHIKQTSPVTVTPVQQIFPRLSVPTMIDGGFKAEDLRGLKRCRASETPKTRRGIYHLAYEQFPGR